MGILFVGVIVGVFQSVVRNRGINFRRGGRSGVLDDSILGVDNLVCQYIIWIICTELKIKLVTFRRKSFYG